MLIAIVVNDHVRTAELARAEARLTSAAPPLLEAGIVQELRRRGGARRRVADPSRPARSHCLLGDNGAGKSTLIKILSGVETSRCRDDLPERRRRRASVAARRSSIAASRRSSRISQSCRSCRSSATSSSAASRRWTRAVPADRHERAREVALQELRDIGIQSASTRAGRSTPFRRRTAVRRDRAGDALRRPVLILDEPTSALGVREAEIVLRFIGRARTEASASSSSRTTRITRSQSATPSRSFSGVEARKRSRRTSSPSTSS